MILSNVSVNEGERLPRIDPHFSTCEAYLSYVLKNLDFELTSQDWDFILGEIVQTMPGMIFHYKY
jgi:hypothetical protein